MSVTLDIAELNRTRDNLVNGLTNISNALNELARSYAQHTNKWVGAESSLPSGVELVGMANLFSTSNANATAPLTGAINGAVEAAGDKKTKKEKKPRKQKDPNAPKRPLTAYFLYTMSARPVVKQDFEDNGQTPTAQEISNEILKRWNEMTNEEKDGWKAIYEKNAEKYREEVKAYLEKTGQAASAEALAAHVDEAVVGVHEIDEDAEAAAPTPKPKSKAGKGKKKDTTAAAATDAASPSAQLTSRSTVPLPNPSKSAEAPPKSSKRKSAAAATEEEPAPKKKRKTKAEVAAEKASKDAAKETSADGPKEKTKTQRKRKSTKGDSA